jgi:hypothetical protein
MNPMALLLPPVPDAAMAGDSGPRGTIRLVANGCTGPEQVAQHSYRPNDNVVTAAGGREGMFDTLLASTQPGEEIVAAGQTYTA